MSLGRREVLLGAAGFGTTALALDPVLGGRPRAETPGEAGTLPMPAPATTLPPPAPIEDPGRTLLDRGWLFHEGDIAAPPPQGHNATYMRAKAGNAAGAAAMEYDDSDWQAVVLPHDWASFQPFVETANLSQGYRPRGIGWYRRTLRLDPADRGRYIELQFGALATNATIWVNGSVAAHNWSGYNSISIDMTPFARFGEELNVIAVRVDADAMEGWWYEGAGLYRHAWLAVRARVAIATDGVHCDPQRGADGSWTVPVAVVLSSIEDGDAAVEVEAALLDSDGHVIATAQVAATVGALATATAALSLVAGTPGLWSIERPTLHTVRVRLIRDGRPVDERRVAIGFRTIRFDPNLGFFLNERAVKLKGVCLHQDHAGVGVAVPDALIRWRLQRLKDMGCNAIRCSHNAPASEFLDLADRMGFLVMDENRNFDPAPDYMAQLEWMVRRDRNHPSVILWSVFNEEPMQGTAAGVEMVRRMAAHVHRLDGSRPVTAAMNGAFFDPVNVSSVVGVTGFNYYQDDYDRFHRLHPDRAMTSSEDTSAFETRGAFASDPARHIASSYDTEFADWGASHRATWKAVAERPFVAGSFVWTGFDYHGEPSPYGWPTIASFFGILDLCGFPKTAYDIHRALWLEGENVVSIAPHWTWPGREGQPIEVFVMSNAERVSLRLDGRSIGEQAVDRFMGNMWTVPYAPGRIEAVAMRAGREVARAAHETAGQPVALRLTPARTVMAGDGEDAQPITIDAIDAHGRHVPTANLMTRFTVAGGAILGVGNGDPNSHESEKGGARALFNGLAQMIVQAGEARGRLTIRAEADGLRAATLEIDRLAVSPRAQVPDVPAATVISAWRRSPALTARPSPDLAPADGDNNSWAFVTAGMPTAAGQTSEWRVYRAAFTSRRRVVAAGGTIRFAAIAGTAELWIDGRKAAAKATSATGPLDAAIAPGAVPHGVVLIVLAEAGQPSGIVGGVTVAQH